MAGDPGRVYVIHLWTGTPEIGLWCTKCALPSGFRVPLYLVNIDGLTLFGQYIGCGDCGAAL